MLHNLNIVILYSIFAHEVLEITKYLLTKLGGNLSNTESLQKATEKKYLVTENRPNVLLSDATIHTSWSGQSIHNR